MIRTPMPFEEAIRFLLDKEQLPAEWDSAMWREQEPDFRTKAFFSAKVENARFLDRAQGLIFDYIAKVTEEIPQPDGSVKVALKVAGREHFVKRMRDFMIAEGMARHEEFASVNQNDVKDLRSLARLRLIFDTNVRQAYGYGQWKQGMTPGALRAFPAARLIRDRGVKEPRLRHQIHLGEVRLKTDARWADYHNAKEIGGFGVPWGPYGFNSGVTQEDVSREEARDLGLPVDRVAPVPGKLTDGTEASTRGIDSSIKAKLLAELRGGPKPADPREAARQAAAEVRREMLNRGLADALGKGDQAKAAKYRQAIDSLPQTGKGLAVQDDGDRITLDENLGQRLAKVLKRSDQGIGADVAIAKKIWETVDRKASEPKTRVDAKKGVARGKQLFADIPKITPEERKILDSPHEILLVHTGDGRLKSVTLGGPNDVEIPPGVPVDAILSHNHPSGRGPSDADLKSVLSSPGMTLRVVGRNENGKIEIFSMKFTGNMKPSEIQTFAEIYFEQCADAGDTHSARRESLALISQMIGDTFEAVTRIFQ